MLKKPSPAVRIDLIEGLVEIEFRFFEDDLAAEEAEPIDKTYDDVNQSL